VPIIQKFTSFSSLVSILKTQNKPDLFLYKKNDHVLSCSGAGFASLVEAKAEAYKKAKFSSLALIGEKTPELAASIFASIIAGKTLLLVDPMESLEKIEMMLSFCDIEQVEVDDSFEEEEIADLKKHLKPSHDAKVNEEGDFLFFTSGTSGTPKAVVLSSASLLDSSFNGQSRLPCGEKDIVFSCLPLSHVFGFVCTFLWPLCYGGSVAFSNGLKNIASDVMLLKPTILPLIPTLAGFLLYQKAINPELETVLVGAGPLSQSLIAGFRALGKKVAFGYGLTETSSGVAISVNSDDPFAMQPCPEDEFRIEEDGTVSIRSGGLMKGYYKNKEATDAVVHEGWLKTNDRGFIDQRGNLHILGRKDDIAVLSNGTKFDCALGEEKLAKYISLPIDMALYANEGRLALMVYLPKPELQDLLGKAVEEFNRSSELYSKITEVNYSKTPLPRTKTGKIIRYQIH
jgi:long-subunit acyl-CoA synthetase (AMP-forming)